LSGFGEGGGGSGYGIGFGRVGNAPRNREAFLADALASAVKACHRSGPAKAAIESTLQEIVDVRDVTLSSGRDASAEMCISEEMWKVSLPGQFDDEHISWAVASK
jgi:hypothetical protein